MSPTPVDGEAEKEIDDKQKVRYTALSYLEEAYDEARSDAVDAVRQSLEPYDVPDTAAEAAVQQAWGRTLDPDLEDALVSSDALREDLYEVVERAAETEYDVPIPFTPSSNGPQSNTLGESMFHARSAGQVRSLPGGYLLTERGKERLQELRYGREAGEASLSFAVEPLDEGFTAAVDDIVEQIYHEE